MSFLQHRRESSSKLRQGAIVASRFKLLMKIGQGSFGTIFRTYDRDTGQLCATKFEKRDDRPGTISLLQREIKVLLEMKGISGFPEIVFYGRDQHYNFFMTNFLGFNLEQLLQKCGGKFNLGTVLTIALQLIDRIEVFHSKNLIHRDIKPENFVIDRDDPSMIFMIDFGLSKYYRSTDGKHIDFVSKRGMIGTARYSSINALQGMEQSRRDDLEAIGYMLVYFLKGELPWMNTHAETKSQKYTAILQSKQSTPLTQLCKSLPKCFMSYFQHIKGLLFTQQPNYTLLRTLFQQALDEIQFCSACDWESLPDVMDMSMEMDIDTNPRPEEEAVVSPLKAGVEQKFIKGLQNKFEEKKQEQLLVPSINDITDCKSKILSQRNSKYNNYNASANEIILSNFKSANLLQVVPTKTRKDSKSQTLINIIGSIEPSKFHKKPSNSDDEMEIGIDYDLNLQTQVHRSIPTLTKIKSQTQQ